jgi:Ca2+-binding RTX toxin-like protein
MAVIFVNIDADGDDDGSSWENAYNNVQDALNNAETNDEIWIAKGEYKPTNNRNRNVSFNLKNSVDVYGGFAGNETSLIQRNLARNETIFSGDIGEQRRNNDNIYHVVKADNLSEETRLDGVTITEGYNTNRRNPGSFGNYGAGLLANNSNLILTNLKVTDNQAQFGAGITISGSNSLTSIVNNIIDDNSATKAGGGLMVLAPEVDVVNNLFINNRSDITGGGVYVWKETANIVNNTFSSNSSQEQGSAITAENGANVQVSNSIVWDNNSTQSGDQVYAKNVVDRFAEAIISVSNSLVENGFSGLSNIDSDPQFVDSNRGDYRLESGSGAIDVGNNQVVIVEVDLDNQPRIVNNIVDLGAYEFSQTINEITGTNRNDNLSGTADADLILGLGGRDRINGRSGNDTLDGGTGNDSLTGSVGNDILIGGRGNDRFDFNSPREGIDTITDFNNGNNLIGISGEGFGAGLESGELTRRQFTLGREASSRQQRFIFNRNNGQLFFDPDGSGSSEQVQLATLTDNASLTFRDFIIF